MRIILGRVLNAVRWKAGLPGNPFHQANPHLKLKLKRAQAGAGG
jgi:hypothetical protein